MAEQSGSTPRDLARRPNPSDPLVSVERLRVATASGEAIVEDVSFALAAGEALGIVGESGSGKTTTVLAMLGYSQPGTVITSGEVRVGDQTITAIDGPAQRRLRGSVVSYVPQNPAGALNPSMRVGDAIVDMLRAHKAKGAAPPPVADALERVGLTSSAEFQRRFPHQLSGGQQQRLCISVALVCEPPVVVLDEPTTGLDVVTQARLLDELVRLRREQGVTMIYVTHDLAVVAGFADSVAVMYAGRIIEHGPTSEILQRPKHPYTRGLLTSIPDHMHPRRLLALPGVAVGVGDRPPGCAFAPRCSLRIDACDASMPALSAVGPRHESRCLRPMDVTDPAPSAPTPQRKDSSADVALLSVRALRAEHRSRRETVVAATDVSFTLRRGQCVALVGESGSGKTTIARTIAGLHAAVSGQILLGDDVLASEAHRRSRTQRQRVQIVFQDPSDALNPRQTVRRAVARAAQRLRGLSRGDANSEADRLLTLVRLPRDVGDRYPVELSGGERQRVGIARALAATPEVLICDEITSALDVSVQAAVLNLLADLQDTLGLAILLITHDLAVVATVADEVLVLERGSVVESGQTSRLLASPQHPYTRSLLAAAPSVTKALAPKTPCATT